MLHEAAMSTRPRPIVGISLKMYFTLARTRDYADAVAAFAHTVNTRDMDVFVIPDFLSVADTVQRLEGSGVRVGAQDAFWEARGAYTGEVSPASVAEAGARYVELGHAERRRLFGETDETVAKKAAAAAAAGLVPLVCIGERVRSADAASMYDDAAAECRPQVESVLAAIPAGHACVLAYEPVWAIGQPEPAGADYVVNVTRRLREMVQATGRSGPTQILYGGSAGPGIFATLHEGVDGLFLGRFAQDPAKFRDVIDEIARANGLEAARP